MGTSWEEMCQQVVIDGRPGDVASAALGWSELLKNLRSVKESLEKNTADLGAVWKGPAFDSFKTHVDGIAKTTGRLITDAEEGDGIVQSLNAAADRLTEAQQEFPIPAKCVNDVLEARNGHLTLGIGFFEAKVGPDFLGLLDPITGLADWLNDKTDEAAKVYDRVGNQYQGQASTMPGQPGTVPLSNDPRLDTPKLNTGGPGGGAPGGVPSLPASATPGGTGAPDLPSTKNPHLPPTSTFEPKPPTTTPPGGYDPPIGPGESIPGGGVPGGGHYGSGLASAAPTPGSGGLPGTSGLGAGGGVGGGAGSGSIPGGGALGRPVAPMTPPMMGGAGGAGAGRGAGGRGAGGRGIGAAGRLAGGAPGMLGGAGGAAGGGRGAGAGRGAGGPGAAARGGVGGRGGLAGAGATGAGYGDDESTRSTWLDEDEDVWGADGDSSPGVLR
ncbi:hypothetical protein [Micromonospora sp. RTGN7]|uniref:WXG100 family type VII secretion target n=1 Tax=Micromonospora sp. RTGN7 TaxID=3016526 RepID=UPI0029FEE8B1|nr:hypothetical protein [Micromonospora sp. RTGN7]